ncbi:TraY domain-containing protein [Yersinia massiliensis]|uniref:TraY domain-containing protein n=1 Tax=Yersinia massiliensis TaxID=419257 RepID=UPI0002EBE811|nr:TraY domain-containing protein [Yersinia massiliensis]QKJ09327.1 TraY domain-containing protein [Yersinia massiliensis]
MDAKNKKYKPMSILLVLSAESNKLLTESALKSGRSKRIEGMLRIDHSLKNIPFVDGDYWEIAPNNKSE